MPHVKNKAVDRQAGNLPVWVDEREREMTSPRRAASPETKAAPD